MKYGLKQFRKDFPTERATYPQFIHILNELWATRVLHSNDGRAPEEEPPKGGFSFS
jgi:hypothetical protein